MATKIFFLGFVVLLTIQGLNASNLTNSSGAIQEVLSNLTSLADLLNKAKSVSLINLQDPNAIIQGIVARVAETMNGAIQTLNSTVHNNAVRDMVVKAVASATQELTAIKDTAQANITSFLAKAEKYGEGALTCVRSNRDTIFSLIESSGSEFLSCTSNVAEKVAPIVLDAIGVVGQLADISSKVTGIAATCGSFAALALPCVVVQGALYLNEFVSSVNHIIADVQDIEAKVPALEREIQTCSAALQTTKSNVTNLLGQISNCTNNYVSSAA